ncbi:MAG: hypothetical protein U1C51_08125 [Candidatus Izemoplasmatales bacterium]|nr:hypothetical protein [bacterium]MDZ4197190.1 hypothetical protein [Candidatus Izemoplasmatales bacterium]
MQIPIVVAHEIAKEIDPLRKNKCNHIFGPDGKCQVSVKYVDCKLFAYDTEIVSAQTRPSVELAYPKALNQSWAMTCQGLTS